MSKSSYQLLPSNPGVVSSAARPAAAAAAVPATTAAPADRHSREQLTAVGLQFAVNSDYQYISLIFNRQWQVEHPHDGRQT
jgi:hypothetical protein